MTRSIVATQRLPQDILPVGQPRLGGGEDHTALVRRDGQNVIAGGVFVGDEGQQPLDRCDIQLERIDAQVGQTDLASPAIRSVPPNSEFDEVVGVGASFLLAMTTSGCNSPRSFSAAQRPLGIRLAHQASATRSSSISLIVRRCSTMRGFLAPERVTTCGRRTTGTRGFWIHGILFDQADGLSKVTF
jgi:hypothetical protein